MKNIHMTFSQIDQRFLAKKDNLQTCSHVKPILGQAEEKISTRIKRSCKTFKVEEDKMCHHITKSREDPV
jgi:hypothetical protein